MQNNGPIFEKGISLHTFGVQVWFRVKDRLESSLSGFGKGLDCWLDTV